MNTEELVREIDARWKSLIDEIEVVCGELNRELPTIIAVSKYRSLEEIFAAYDVGIRDFGENYPQELNEKASSFKKPTWHFIGHLQRRNAKYVIPHVKYIHSLDSQKIVNRLSYLKYTGKCLIQVNISNEISKSGIPHTEEAIKQILDTAKKVNLQVVGFMAMGGFSWKTEEIVNHFTSFTKLIKPFELPQISLGMSRDFKEAIRVGSTFLRIGTRIFGERPT